MQFDNVKEKITTTKQMFAKILFSLRTINVVNKKYKVLPFFRSENEQNRHMWYVSTYRRGPCPDTRWSVRVGSVSDFAFE